MSKKGSVLVLLALAVAGQALTPNSYLLAAGDADRFKAIFGGAAPYTTDTEAVYYSVLGFTLLDAPIPDPQGACVAVKQAVNVEDVASMFHATMVATLLKASAKLTCQWNQGVTDARDNLAAASVSLEESTETIHQALATMTGLNHKIDHLKVGEALDAALKRDDTPASYAHAFLAASLLPKGDVSRFHDAIEDVVAQADEVDDVYLQFDGGLSTTALVVEGAYRLAAYAKLKPSLTEGQVVKFANYLLSRKRVSSLKGAVSVLSAIKRLANNEYHLPIAVTLASNVVVNAANPLVQVRVTNILGGAVSAAPLTVTAHSARHAGDDAVMMSKAPFKASELDPTLYELDLMVVKPASGFYKVTVNVVPSVPDPRLLATTGAEVEVKVTTSVSVEGVELGVADKDQTSAARMVSLTPPHKAATPLEADHQQKVQLKFQLRGAGSTTPITAHQTFVRLTHATTQREIQFVAEPDATKTYKFELDVGASTKEFGGLSGTYHLDLIVGDAVIDNPTEWRAADIALTFPESVTQDPEAVASRYAPLPEIHHVFREAEPRPAVAISQLFTGLVFVPLLIMLALWLRIGANLGNFTFSPTTLAFHALLGGIFVLYYLYWTRLNMFETIRYLALIGTATFLLGNRLLSGLAAARKQ